MCGGGGGGGGGSVNRVSAPRVPPTPAWQGDPAPRTEVRVPPTPLFTEDKLDTRKPPPPVAAKRPTPLSTLVEKVTNVFRPPVESRDEPARAPPPAKKPPAVRAAPPMPIIPVSQPVIAEPVAPPARRPAPV